MNIVFWILFLFLVSPSWAVEQFVYDAHDKRDPMWSLVTESGVVQNFDNDLHVSELTLQGIVTDPMGKNAAIINGRIIKKNEMVGQYLVVEITKDTVELTKGQEKFRLKLQKEE